MQAQCGFDGEATDSKLNYSLHMRHNLDKKLVVNPKTVLFLGP